MVCQSLGVDAAVPRAALDAANRYRCGLKSLEPEHRPYPLFDSAMILLDNIVQVLAAAYANAARYVSRFINAKCRATPMRWRRPKSSSWIEYPRQGESLASPPGCPF
jgi:hypothetical protein